MRDLKDEVLKALGVEVVTISQIRDRINERQEKRIEKLVKSGKLDIVQALKEYKASLIERPDVRNALDKLLKDKKVQEIKDPKYAYKLAK